MGASTPQLESESTKGLNLFSYVVFYPNLCNRQFELHKLWVWVKSSLEFESVLYNKAVGKNLLVKVYSFLSKWVLIDHPGLWVWNQTEAVMRLKVQFKQIAYYHDLIISYMGPSFWYLIHLHGGMWTR